MSKTHTRKAEFARASKQADIQDDFISHMSAQLRELGLGLGLEAELKTTEFHSFCMVEFLYICMHTQPHRHTHPQPKSVSLVNKHEWALEKGHRVCVCVW